MQRGLYRKKTIMGMIFSEYKGKIFEFSFVGIVVACVFLVAGNLLRKTSDILKNGKLNEISVIKELGAYFIANMLLKAIGKFI